MQGKHTFPAYQYNLQNKYRNNLHKTNYHNLKKNPKKFCDYDDVDDDDGNDNDNDDDDYDVNNDDDVKGGRGRVV